jgi:hypothetical protein
MTKTLISHFYNEEFLLPFWIRHHYEIFDHGILINHGSTDNSIALIRKLAPNWKIIDSKLKSFDPIMTDFEVQKIEESISGWKICLNTSEFLVGDLDGVLSECDRKGIQAISTIGIIMVDHQPTCVINPSVSLISQKPWGIVESRLYDFLFRGGRFRKILKALVGYKSPYQERSRLLHKKTIGAYRVGRHSWEHLDANVSKLYTLWFGFSPWSDNFIGRKLSFAKKLPSSRLDLGAHHRLGIDKLNSVYKKHLLVSNFIGIDIKNFLP